MTYKINDNGVDRNATNDEIAQIENDEIVLKTETATQIQAQTAKQVARQAVLDKLGLTADEAQALFG